MATRALGINAVIRAGFESVYGTPPVSTVFNQMPFISSTLGAEVPLIEDDQIGTGREPLDPTLDVTTNDGDVVVPVDTKGFGKWLKLLLGLPATTGSGPYTHVFNSGSATLPTMSIEVGHPEIPAYFTNIGVSGNQMQIAMARRGQLNATISCVAQDETPHPGDSAVTTSQAPSATLLRGLRFAQATGEVSKDGVQLGGVVSASLTFSNNDEKVETIRPDGLIDGVDPLKVMVSGQIVVRFADLTLFNAANGSPVAINCGWVNGIYSLLFHMPRIFLPRVKRPIQGPNGIQATFNFQGSGASGHALTATLVNDVTSYAT